MTDIVERLRLENDSKLAFGRDFSDLLLDAAARIEGLEDALKMQCEEAGDIMSEVVAAANKDRDAAATRIEELEAALEFFFANEPTLEDILWSGMDDNELMMISIRLGAYKAARAVLDHKWRGTK
jgi:hypothetical protein